jgi:MFS family permease
MTAVLHDSRSAAVAADEDFGRGYRAWLLFLLVAANVLNMADRQGLAAIAPAIKAELGLSDTQLGLVQGLGFAIFYTAMGLPLARLAESRSRVRIVAVSVAIFAVMAAACGTARSFVQLLMCRIGVAIGDAGFGPPVGSLLGDHYPAHRRATVTTIIWLGAPIGAVLGSTGGGWIAQSANWRVWFYVLAVPSVLISALIWFTLREPRRGLADGVAIAPGSPPSMPTVLRFLWAKRSMRHVLIGAALGAITLNGTGQFIARFFVAAYGMGYAEAGRNLGLIGLVSMASGFALGGFGMERLGRTDRRWYALGPGIALIVSAPLLVASFSRADMHAAMPLLIASQIALFVFYTPTLAIAQNMVAASMRASSAFLMAFVLGLVGTGLGPLLVGFLSDLYSHAAFGGDYARLCAGVAADLPACRAASGAGVRHALMTIPIFALWAGVHYCLAARTIVRDLDTVYRP